MTIEITGLGINAGAAAPKASNTGSGDFSAVMEKTALESRIDLDTIFARAAEKYGVSVDLLKAVAKAESNFNPDATSACGAMGIMQLMPGTATGLGVTDAYDPVQNIMGGAKFLSQLLKRFDGNTTLAVAAYNAGPNNVIKYDGIPPFKETQNYVRKVLGYLGDRIIAGSVASGSPAAGRTVVVTHVRAGVSNIDATHGVAVDGGLIESRQRAFGDNFFGAQQALSFGDRDPDRPRCHRRRRHDGLLLLDRPHVSSVLPKFRNPPVSIGRSTSRAATGRTRRCSMQSQPQRGGSRRDFRGRVVCRGERRRERGALPR